jgi:hypothetical protein
MVEESVIGFNLTGGDPVIPDYPPCTLRIIDISNVA